MSGRITAQYVTVSAATLNRALQKAIKGLDSNDRHYGRQVERVEVGRDGCTGEWFVRLYLEIDGRDAAVED